MTKKVAWLIVLILFSSSVFAIGISPAKIYNNFEPGLSYTKEFQTWNTMDRPIDISLSVEGDLAEYITLSETYFEQVQPNENRKFLVTVNLPVSLDSGGLKMSYIRATEENRNEKGTINVRGAVRTRIEVKVAIEGKSVEITSATGSNIPQGAASYFEGVAHNYGTITVNQMNGYLTVLDQEEKQLFNTRVGSHINIKSYEGREFFTQIPSQSWGPGRYKLNFKVDYDGELVERNTSFIIGELKVDVFNLTSEIETGEISDFEFSLKNKWNEQVKDAYADIKIYDDVNVYLITKTHNFDIGPWEEKRIETFLNGKKLRAGNYKVEVKLNYADKNTIAISDFSVKEKGQELKASSGEAFKFPTGNGVIYGLVGLVVLTIGSLVSMNLLLLRKLNQLGPKIKRIKKK